MNFKHLVSVSSLFLFTILSAAQSALPESVSITMKCGTEANCVPSKSIIGYGDNLAYFEGIAPSIQLKGQNTTLAYLRPYSFDAKRHLPEGEETLIGIFSDNDRLLAVIQENSQYQQFLLDKNGNQIAKISFEDSTPFRDRLITLSSQDTVIAELSWSQAMKTWHIEQTEPLDTEILLFIASLHTPAQVNHWKKRAALIGVGTVVGASLIYGGYHLYSSRNTPFLPKNETNENGMVMKHPRIDPRFTEASSIGMMVRKAAFPGNGGQLDQVLPIQKNVDASSLTNNFRTKIPTYDAVDRKDVPHFLDAYWVANPKKYAATRNPTVILFHGNGMTGQEMTEMYGKFYRDLGFNMLAVTMRGYAGSDGDAVKSGGLGPMIDARSALRFARTQLGIAEEDLLVHGLSIGTFQAALLRKQFGIRAAILDQPFTSFEEVAEERAATPLARWLVRDGFPRGHTYILPDGERLVTNGMNVQELTENLNKGIFVVYARKDELFPHRFKDQILEGTYPMREDENDAAWASRIDQYCGDTGRNGTHCSAFYKNHETSIDGNPTTRKIKEFLKDLGYPVP